MCGIPQALLSSLKQVFLECDEFYNPRQLRAIFDSAELKPWQNALPVADNPSAQIDITISYIGCKKRSEGKFVFPIFLRTLGDRYDPEDERHLQLHTLADQLDWVWQRPAATRAETTLEANPQQAQMLSLIEVERMVECARAVARVNVPCIRKGKQVGNGTGTGWLISPTLALTCWHVIEGRRKLELSVEPEDLQAQVKNTLFTFDYTVAGRGLQYGAATLEHPKIESPAYDCAVLRLNDREDKPLRDRGYLRLDTDAPLTSQTSLYIIQHPLGQPQQVAGDTFEQMSPESGCILYKTPTEPGTSGGPVFNRQNWQVIALHRGEHESEKLREGTLLKVILADLQQHRPDLYDEIQLAQLA